MRWADQIWLGMRTHRRALDARVGEAGKGFAVVAGEGKELSGRTARSTDRIRGMVGAIQVSSRAEVEAFR